MHLHGGEGHTAQAWQARKAREMGAGFLPREPGSGGFAAGGGLEGGAVPAGVRSGVKPWRGPRLGAKAHNWWGAAL